VTTFPSAEIVPPTLRVVAGATFEIPMAFPVMTVTFEPPETFEMTKRFEPSVVVTGPIVAPLKVCKVPTVAKGTVKVSAANDAFPVTVSGLVGFVVPIPTHAFELMTTTFEPPEMLEKRATFVPMVPGPTCRVFDAKTFVVVTVFETYKFANG
jgi:hypothetical protein